MLDKKEWNEALDEYIWENKIQSNDYENMNDIQQTIIQEIKKSRKRVIARESKKL